APELLSPMAQGMRLVENISGEDGHDPITEMASGKVARDEADVPPRTNDGAAGRPASTDGQGKEARISPRARAEAQVPFEAGERVGRNDPCPCGSGKKYKICCMIKAA